MGYNGGGLLVFYDIRGKLKGHEYHKIIERNLDDAGFLCGIERNYIALHDRDPHTIIV